MPSSLSLSHSHSLPIPSARPLSPKGVLRAGNGHSHTHTVLSILYLLAARQNKVCLEDKFPVARDHINILIPGLRPSALPRATNIPPRWGGGGRIEWLNRMDRRWRLCFCRWGLMCRDVLFRAVRPYGVTAIDCCVCVTSLFVIQCFIRIKHLLPNNPRGGGIGMFGGFAACRDVLH